MQCVILAAGKGARMGSLTDDCPKPMLPIRNKPKLAHTIENLPRSIAEVVVVIGYLGERIRSYFGDSYAGKSIRYVRQDVLNGTGGSLFLAKEMLGERFLVIMGDDLYLASDLERLLRHEVALLAIEVEDSTSFGVLVVDEDGRLSDVREKPHDGSIKIVNTGAYALVRDIIRYPLVPVSPTEYGLPQTILQMRDVFPITVEIAKAWLPIGSPEAYELAKRRIDEFIL